MRKTAVAVVLAAAVRTAAGSTAARWDDGRRLNNGALRLDGGDRCPRSSISKHKLLFKGLI